MKYKVNDLVYFNDNHQTGVGKIVAVVEETETTYLTYLVHSTQIVNGHESYGDNAQDNTNNWWFKEAELKPFFKKVGQKYKVIGDVKEYAEISIGDIITLISIENDNLSYYCNEDVSNFLMYDLGSRKPEVEFFEEDSIILDSDIQEVPLGEPLPMAKAPKEEKTAGNTYINGKEVSKEVYDTIAEFFLDEGEDEGVVLGVVLSKTPPTPGKTALEGAGYTRVPLADEESWAAKTYTVGFRNGLAKVTMPTDSSIYLALWELQAIAMRLDETIDEGESNEN